MINANTCFVLYKFSGFFAAIILIIAVSCQEPTERVLPNENRGLQSANNDEFDFAPPLTADAWTIRDRYLEPSTNEQIFGQRITPRDILDFGDIYGLLYQSRDYDHPTTESASIMFSHDKINWVDSPANPIFGELIQPWQGTRAMAEALDWDDGNDRWVMIITGNGEEHYPGLRATGLVYSKDLLNWELESNNPVITSENIDWTDGSTNRVYVRGFKKYQGYWYVWIVVNTEVGLLNEPALGARPGEPVDDIGKMNIGLLKSQDLLNWESIPANPILQPGMEGEWDDRMVLPGRPILFENRWYLAYTNEARNQVGIAWSDTLEGKWHKAPGNPILDFDDISLEGTEAPILTPMGVGWGIILAAWDPNERRQLGKMTIATARFSPEILPDF
ncbi:MAG: hypothetical protein WD267_10045 [Balneolales bacterium]